ncbi:DUF1146 family protein [Aquibacillus sp. 3ASR75-11]|uniref:DUF1146 family protein n=1 Tax=Terrihalobacillus insolitus TaxID=2950438 RepID=A0A9X4ANZ2_9BACI|nr:DUF1146 family protein [Terrihalobacillus insolitus]MDC3411801.1 DUF1146 family protein [Terrihalobacillus insolitus]MDC3425020.1 DUF1146 family protein [Terrihalobacillus insolitus]
METIGQQALTGIISHLFFIGVTWRVLQAVNMDPLFKKGRVFEARVLIVFLTITIGTTVSNFFLDYLQWSGQLMFLF